MRQNETKNNHTQRLKYDIEPQLNDFPGIPDSCFDLINQYGTYEIQRTADTENRFPMIAQGLAKDADLLRPDKRDDL